MIVTAYDSTQPKAAAFEYLHTMGVEVSKTKTRAVALQALASRACTGGVPCMEAELVGGDEAPAATVDAADI
eukprot:9106638-Prorocentrum_lima.AAC.1